MSGGLRVVRPPPEGEPQVAAPQTSTLSGSGPSDAALVVAARAGERWAAEALFHRYVRMVNRLAFRLMGRDVDVDDLVQETFAQALMGLDRLNEPGAFSGWLAAIVARTAHKKIRHRQVLRRFGLWTREEPIDLDTVVGREAPPDTAAELRAVYGALHRLPADVRVPLVLHRIEGLPLAEVATMTGVSLATIKRRIAAAEEALAQDEPRDIPERKP